jgi:hypothetical protein
LTEPNGILNGLPIDDGQSARHAQTNGAGMGIWLHAEKLGTTATKHFTTGTEFNMHFHANDRLIFHHIYP